MLQVEVDASQEVSFAIENINQQIAALDIPGKANKLAINALMKTVANAKKLTPKETGILGEVREMLVDDILVGLKDEKNSKDVAAAVVKNDTDACNANGLTEAVSKWSNVETTLSEHDTCRVDQLTEYTGKDAICSTAEESIGNAQISLSSHCTTLGNLANSVFNTLESNYPSAVLDDAVTALASLKQRYELFLKPGQMNEDLVYCQANMTSYSDLVDTCNTAQLNYEQAYCNYKNHLEDMCATRESCYNNATDAHDARWALMNEASEARIKMACLIKHVVCLIDELTNPNGTMATQGAADALTACDHIGMDPEECRAEYGNVEPVYANLSPCDDSNISGQMHPGQCSFASERWDTANWWSVLGPLAATGVTC